MSDWQAEGFRRGLLKCEIVGCGNYAVAAQIFARRPDGAVVLMYRCGLHVGRNVFAVNSRAEVAIHRPQDR